MPIDAIKKAEEQLVFLKQGDMPQFAEGFEDCLRLFRATPEQPDELPPVEEIKPCPYVNGFAADNAGVSFMLKRYPNYSDFILFEDGRPSRCFRFDGFAVPLPVRESGWEAADKINGELCDEVGRLQKLNQALARSLLCYANAPHKRVHFDNDAPGYEVRVWTSDWVEANKLLHEVLGEPITHIEDQEGYEKTNV